MNEHGRVLILEGLENAERNVLPILNNLLESREIALEDGCFLVSPQRYAFLRAEAAKNGLNVSSAVQTSTAERSAQPVAFHARKSRSKPTRT